MVLNKTLNATCDLDGYLFCRMPVDTLEEEIKVKTSGESAVCFRTHIQRSIMHGIEPIREQCANLEDENTPQRSKKKP